MAFLLNIFRIHGRSWAIWKKKQSLQYYYVIELIEHILWSTFDSIDCWEMHRKYYILSALVREKNIKKGKTKIEIIIEMKLTQMEDVNMQWKSLLNHIFLCWLSHQKMDEKKETRFSGVTFLWAFVRTTVLWHESLSISRERDCI